MCMIGPFSFKKMGLHDEAEKTREISDGPLLLSFMGRTEPCLSWKKEDGVGIYAGPAGAAGGHRRGAHIV